MRGRLERIGIFYGNSGGVGENTGYFAFVHGGGCDRLSDRLDQGKVFFAGLELKNRLAGHHQESYVFRDDRNSLFDRVGH